MNKPLTEQPSIYIGDIRIDEPVTTLTDLLVAAVCFYAYVRLRQKSTPKIMVMLMLQYFFLFMGIATVIGGLIGHGFLYALSFEWKLPGWLTSMISVTLAERAVILRSKKYISTSLFTFFSWLNIIELLTFMALSFSTLQFIFVEIHTAYGLLLVVGSFSAFLYRKSRDQSSKYFLYAVGLATLAAIAFSLGIGISPWFNHMDISHVFMALSAALFYRGSVFLFYQLKN